jgi:hypothetical protein
MNDASGYGTNYISFDDSRDVFFSIKEGVAQHVKGKREKSDPR